MKVSGTTNIPSYNIYAINEATDLQKYIIKQLPNILIAAIVLIITFNWNTAISKLFDYYVPKNIFKIDSVWRHVVDSLIMTFIAFILIYLIIRGSVYLEKYIN